MKTENGLCRGPRLRIRQQDLKPGLLEVRGVRLAAEAERNRIVRKRAQEVALRRSSKAGETQCAPETCAATDATHRGTSESLQEVCIIKEPHGVHSFCT